MKTYRSSVIVIIVTLASCLMMPSHIFSIQGSEPQSTAIATSYERKIYGCDSYGDTVHCDPIPSNWNSYSIQGVESNVNPVIRSNETYLSQGKYFKALELNEKYREFVEIPYLSDFDSKHFSLSFWLKPDSEGSPYGHIISHVNKNQTAGWFLDETNTQNKDATNGTLRFVVVDNAGGQSSISVNKTEYEFIHLVATFDGSMLKVYENGILYGNEKFNGNYTSEPGLPVRIGSAAYCFSCNRWSGTIDEVRFYNNTLSASQVQDLFSNSSNVAFDNLVAYYNFDDNSSDKSGKSNHGSIFSLLSSMVFSPDNRLFFSEKNTGKIKIMKDDKVLDNPFVQISDHYVDWEQGLLGLTVDPKFEQNHFVYLYYTYLDANSGIPYNRVVRFTDTNNTATDMLILLNNIPASRGFHSGGALAFGPDDKLYITVGDATDDIEAQNSSSLLGKILRINRDGTIPDDNPFPNSPVYTMGHRNMYGIAFDNNTGLGIVTENGDALYDEINLIQKSGNYGFPTFQPANVSPELSNLTLAIKPIRSYWATIGPTQGIFYTGDKFPLLKDMYLFGTFTGNIYGIRLDTDTKQIVEEIHVLLKHYPFEAVVGIAQSPDGGIFFGGYNLYELTGLEADTIQQDMFTVEIESSDNLETIKFQLSDTNKSIDIRLNIQTNTKDNLYWPFIALEIPEKLIERIRK